MGQDLSFQNVAIVVRRQQLYALTLQIRHTKKWFVVCLLNKWLWLVAYLNLSLCLVWL